MKASELMNEPITIHVYGSGYAVVTPYEARLQQAFEILENQLEEITEKLVVSNERSWKILDMTMELDTRVESLEELDDRLTELENRRSYIEALNLKEMRELRDAIKENVKNTPELINALDSIIKNVEPFIERVIELETRIENLEKFYTIPSNVYKSDSK